MFTPLTEKQKSAQAEKGSKRLSKPTTTPPPHSAPPSPAAPVAVTGKQAEASDAPTVKKARSGKQAENDALVSALSEAWGIQPANSDYSLFVKQAKKLVGDGIPPEEFKAFCDWRKREAGDFASKIRIGSLIGSGHVSAYLAQRNKHAAEEEAHRRLLDTIPPEYLPRVVPPEQRASQEQIDAALAKFRTPIFPASDAGEKIS